MKYFISNARLTDFTTVLGNVDAKLFAPLIPSAADQWIKPITGSHFFEDLLSKFNSQSLSPEEEKVVGMIQQSLLWRVASEVVLTSSSQITNKGPQEQNGDNSSPSSTTRIGMLTKHYGSKSDFYNNRLIHFLWDNKKDFPEFTSKLNMDCDVDLFPTKKKNINGIKFI